MSAAEIINELPKLTEAERRAVREKLSELAALTSARVEGDANTEIIGAAGLDVARSGYVTFLSIPRFTPRVNQTAASAIYAAEDAQIVREIRILRA